MAPIRRRFLIPTLHTMGAAPFGTDQSFGIPIRVGPRKIVAYDRLRSTQATISWR